MLDNNNFQSRKSRGLVKSYDQDEVYGSILNQRDQKEYEFSVINVLSDSIDTGDEVEYVIVQTPEGPYLKDIVVTKKGNGLFQKIYGTLARAGNRKFILLLMGKTGVGKSSMINTLIGKYEAPIGYFKPGTFEVSRYQSRLNGVAFEIIDTPGLCDELPEKGNDLGYIKKIQANASRFDCFLFVTPIFEERLRADEKRGIQLISKSFGAEIWKKSIIIFSFADRLRADEYQSHLIENLNNVRKEISIYTDKNIADGIPYVVISNQSKTTPDGKLWLGELFTKVFAKISEEGALPFFIATAERLRMVEEIVSPGRSTRSETITNTSFPFLAKSEDKQSKAITFTQAVSSEKRSTITDPPIILLNQQQKIEIQERINHSPEMKVLGNVKAILEMVAAGATLAFTFTGGNPFGAVVGGAVFGAVTAIAWIFDIKK